jgi:hypothetical protein
MLVVEIDSNLVVPDELDKVDVAITANGTTPVTPYSLISDYKLPLHVGVVETGDGAGNITIVASGYRGPTAVVSETAIVGFVEGKSMLLKLFLARECIGKTCPIAGQTCTTGGTCRDSVRNSNDLTPFTPSDLTDAASVYGDALWTYDSGTSDGASRGGDAADAKLDATHAPDSVGDVRLAGNDASTDGTGGAAGTGGTTGMDAGDAGSIDAAAVEVGSSADKVADVASEVPAFLTRDAAGAQPDGAVSPDSTSPGHFDSSTDVPPVVLMDARPNIDSAVLDAPVAPPEVALDLSVPTSDVAPDRAVDAAYDAGTSSLVVVRTGAGGGTIISSPVGINCGPICQADFIAETVVTLTATADATSVFTGWSGACSGPDVCQLAMDTAKSVKANFDIIQYTLSVTKTGAGGGTVTSNPPGITCGDACSASFNTGTAVTLIANPDGTSTFTGWSDACSGTQTCLVAVDAAKSATANFVPSVPFPDGTLTVAATNTIVNGYSALVASANAGTSVVIVNDIVDFATGGLPALGPGDLVLIIQMAGATIDTTDTAAYGTVASLNNAGSYELAGVAGMTGNVITLSCVLQRSYTATDKAQVIRVPQYSALTIDSGASITAPAWNGTVGGVVAVQAATTLQLTGNIDVSAKGFRGGAIDNSSANMLTDVSSYRSTSAADGAEKGESIAGSVADYDNLLSGRYGRGAPANGGGGGNSHNAGGGGGANASASGLTWNGQGLMLGMVTGGTGAWPLDPGYVANGGYTNSSGGGRGGYTYSAINQDATSVGPGVASWGGNYRRERGGLGGPPLVSSPTTRLFLGGGGGAGDGNNGVAGPGGNGGGLVFVIAGTVVGAGSILANGAAGGAANSGAGTSGDAAGGGGGGGTVVVHAGVLSAVISVAVNGGVGGSQQISVAEADGPGGGGGGGYIALSGGSPAAVSANGSLGGTTNSTALSEFPSNGATAGKDGQTDGDATTVLYCTSSASPDTTIASAPAQLTNVAAAAFFFVSNQGGVTFECSLDGAAYLACPASYTTPALSDGPHTISVRARDRNGNVDATPATFAWTVDTVAPDTVIVTYPADPSSTAVGNFTFTSNEPGAVFQCSLDGATFAACPASYSTPALANGSHTLEVRAIDSAGNVGPPVDFTWTVHVSLGS